jgi:hypothetical protein
MAMPVTSWQGIVLGDPLYQPFKHLNGTGTIVKEDRDFRALRAAKLQWSDDPVERSSRIQQAAERNGSGLLTEAVGLDLLERGLTAEAALQFRNARLRYVSGPDKLRQDFHLIGIDRRAGRLDMAIRELRDAKLRYGPIPEADAIQAWLDLVDPPKPAASPPAAPK